MNIFLLILAIVIGIIIIVAYCAAVFIFIYRRYILVEIDDISNGNFSESIDILRTIINSELEQYERDVFKDRVIITNSNFEEYYNDLTKKIIDGLSPQLMKHLMKYFTEDFVYRMIARTVKEYLQKKIGETL